MGRYDPNMLRPYKQEVLKEVFTCIKRDNHNAVLDEVLTLSADTLLNIETMFNIGIADKTTHFISYEYKKFDEIRYGAEERYFNISGQNTCEIINGRRIFTMIKGNIKYDTNNRMYRMINKCQDKKFDLADYDLCSDYYDIKYWLNNNHLNNVRKDGYFVFNFDIDMNKRNFKKHVDKFECNLPANVQNQFTFDYCKLKQNFKEKEKIKEVITKIVNLLNVCGIRIKQAWVYQDSQSVMATFYGRKKRG